MTRPRRLIDPPFLTRQGVRNLGNNTRRYRSAVCHPHLPGSEYVVVGWTHNDDRESEPVYAKRCIKCGEAC